MSKRPAIEARFPSPSVMGVINVTPDSFSDGGVHLRLEPAVTSAWGMLEAGAAIIDVGGVKAGPGAEVSAAEEIARELDCTSREVRDILRMSQQPVSLEKPIGEEEDSALGDFIEDASAESPFDIASKTLRDENVCRALAVLPRREREVIEMRFGLTGGQPCTLEEVGKAFGVTRERIRQIENNTLKKLESLPEAQALRNAE